VSSFLDDLEEIQLETKSRFEIEGLRVTCAAVKFRSPEARIAMKLCMDHKLLGPGGNARDDLAKRMCRHYLYGNGDFNLTIEDMKWMNSGRTEFSSEGPINLRVEDYGEVVPRKEWNDAVFEAETKNVPFSGALVWGWDNGAIASYKVHYAGVMHRDAAGSVEWRGTVAFTDRFDLDPRWGWTPNNPQGRTALGERHTRMGYIVDVGHDYDVRSEWISAKQGARENALTLL
jgi:hypothetical protein